MRKQWVLIVEDDKLDRFLIEHAFKKLETSVEFDFAHDAESAWETLENGNRPTLIVTDLNMPGIGGMELLSRIKRSDQLKTIPTIVFSTSSDDEDLREAYNRFANSYVVKPGDAGGYSRFAERVNSYWMQENRYLCH